MPRVRDMQGEAAHLTYLKSNDGEHRHPSKCFFACGTGRDRICNNPHCVYYSYHCSSAAHCDHYKETKKRVIRFK